MVMQINEKQVLSKKSKTSARCVNKFPDKTRINCSPPSCGKPAIIKRWFRGPDPCPVIVVYLCSNCKDIPLWNEDVIKEERV